jgi:hypothetical protein
MPWPKKMRIPLLNHTVCVKKNEAAVRVVFCGAAPLAIFNGDLNIAETVLKFSNEHSN